MARLGTLRQGLSLSVVRAVAKQLASFPLATDPDPTNLPDAADGLNEPRARTAGAGDDDDLSSDEG